MSKLNPHLKQFLVVFSIIFTILSCDRSTSNEKTKENPVVLAPDVKEQEYKIKDTIQVIPAGTERNDSIFLSGNFILFYYPSDYEIKSSDNQKTQSPEYDSMIAEFKGMSAQVFDSLGVLDLPINVAITNVSNFCISMDEGNRMYFNRNSLKFPVGIIMMDGLQAPVIRSGNHTKSDYFQFIKSYFVAVNWKENNQKHSPSI